MASCAYCNSTILFGGKKQGDLKFCNSKCAEKGALASVAAQIPKHDVDRFVAEVHGGTCPTCSGQGPVDLHTSYRIYSALFFSSWSSRPAVCCQRCGTKRKIGDTLFSAILGWWGVPWGFLITPVQIGRNLLGLFQPPDPKVPSQGLEKIHRLQLAAQALQSQSSVDTSAKSPWK